MGGADEIARTAPPLSPPRTLKGAPHLGAPDESPAVSIDTQQPANEPRTLIVTIAGRIDRADVARLSEPVMRHLSAPTTSLVVCDVGGLVEPDAAAVDAICRIRLASRRIGSHLRLRGASSHLLELLDLMGLCDVLPLAPRSELEAER